MLVITSDAARGTTQESVDAALAVLRGATPDLEVAACADEDDLGRALDRRGGRPLVIAGGDGSLHTVIQLLHRRGELADCPVGLVPLGTGNDFARGLGVPLDPDTAARAIVSSRERRLDLLVDDGGGVAVNAVHVGAGGEAARAAAPLKPSLGPLAFPLGSVVAGLSTPGWRLRVEADGRVVADGRDKLLMLGVCNAPSIAGGSAELAPDAVPDDGVADVIVSYATGPLSRLGYALRLRKGSHRAQADVSQTKARTVTVSGEAFPVNADGEVDGPVGARTWAVIPGAWRFMVPA